MSRQVKIETVIRADQGATPDELLIVAKIDRNNDMLKAVPKGSRKYESLHVSNSGYRRKLKVLRANGDKRLDREISDDINVLKYYIFISGNEITKVRQQLSEAIIQGRNTAGHQIYLNELEGWQKKYKMKLTKLRKVLL